MNLFARSVLLLLYLVAAVLIFRFSSSTEHCPMYSSKKESLASLTKPYVIAHRGASGYLPEHTLPAYLVAIEQGADFVEPDLVMTRDGELVARHDNVLDLTTDVANQPGFANKKTRKKVDGIDIEGWFSEDFNLHEIKKLRAIERIPEIRPANTRFDGMFVIPTLQEIINLVQAVEKSTGRRIGIYPETKHPTHFANLGLPMENKLVDILHGNGYRENVAPIFIQSFETANLKKLRTITRLPLIQLMWSEGQPYDVETAGGRLSYDDMATPSGLKTISDYADGAGPEKYHFIIPKDTNGNLEISATTEFVKNAHAVGLEVHPYTFRAENSFLPTNLRRAGGNASGTPHGIDKEIQTFLNAGIDGFFTDQTDIGVRARNEFFKNGKSN